MYLPGKTDAGYRNNVWLIYRGIEGNWFHAWNEWENLAHPLIAEAGPRTDRRAARVQFSDSRLAHQHGTRSGHPDVSTTADIKMIAALCHVRVYFRHLRGGVMPQAQPGRDLDATRLDPKHYRLETENEQVRIIRVRYGAGERSVMHAHPSSIVVFLTTAASG